MKDFCTNVDKFVEENNIVIKNGNVEGFWKDHDGINKNDDNTSDGVQNHADNENDSNREIIFERSIDEENDTKVNGTSSEEELINEQDDRKIAELINIDDVRDNENKNDDKNDDKSDDKNDPSGSEGVYDLLTLKVSPKILLNTDTMKSSKNAINEDDNESYFEKSNSTNSGNDDTISIEGNDDSTLLEKSNNVNLAVNCKEHLTKQAMTFTQQKSPLLEKCIDKLINDNENEDDNNGKKRLNSWYNDSLTNPRSVFTEAFEDFYKGRSTTRQNIGVNVDTRIQRRSHYRDVSGDTTKSDLCAIGDLVKRSDEERKTYDHADLYKEFCERFEELQSKQKYAIMPDFLKNKREDDDKRHVRTGDRTSENSNDKRAPLIEDITEESTNLSELEGKKEF